MPKTMNTRRERCWRNPRHKLQLPSVAEAANNAHSTGSDARKLRPKSGNSATTKGINAQWIAHKNEAVAPARSNLFTLTTDFGVTVRSDAATSTAWAWLLSRALSSVRINWNIIGLIKISVYQLSLIKTTET